MEERTEKPSNAQQEKKSKESPNKKRSQSRRKAKKYSRAWIYISRIINPEKWSLNGRFVWFSGLLLLAGLFITYIFVSITLDNTLQNQLRYRLESFNSHFQQAVHRKEKEHLKTAMRVTSLPGVFKSLKNKDHQSLENIARQFNQKIRLEQNIVSTPLQFYLADGEPFLNIGGIKAIGDAHQPSEKMVRKARKELRPAAGIDVTQKGIIIGVAYPLLQEDNCIGTVEAFSGLDSVFQELHLSEERGVLITLNKSVSSKISDNPEYKNVNDQVILLQKGNMDLQGFIRSTRKNGGFPSRTGPYRILTRSITNFQNKKIGYVHLFEDATGQMANRKRHLNIFLLFGVAGTLFLWLFLFLNVRRIKNFLDRMKKILIASHFNDFADRFETDNVHCLEVLNCPNVECPVYQDPTRVCYLETGDEAISPKWRDTCIFLNKYKTCSNCPVYQMRHGDELMEMRHVVNTMMRLWSQFLGHIGQLLSEVFRTKPGGMPSLDQVSSYLEHMARLTTFAHDLQGVYDKKEVLMHLEHAFRNTFGLADFHLLEVNSSENRMHVAINNGELQSSHAEVLLNCDLCRAKRISEEVSSAHNPMLCPYFSINPERQVRCCLPMIMGGEVGAVFTFVVDKMQWEKQKDNIQFIRKYLDEAAPVLSSLRLLQLSRERSMRDPLTGAYNRRFMDEYLAQTEILSKREKKRIGFIMADIDHFKMINDQYGHQAGDQLLKQLIEIIQSNIRRSDLVVRYGGEEFLILLVDPTNEGDAEKVAEKMRKAVEENYFLLPNDERIHKTISLGVAEFPEDAEQLYQTIKYADVALYQAKESGRNQTLRFKKHMWTEETY